MDKRPDQFTLPLFGEPGSWEAPTPKPPSSEPEKSGKRRAPAKATGAPENPSVEKAEAPVGKVEAPVGKVEAPVGKVEAPVGKVEASVARVEPARPREPEPPALMPRRVTRPGEASAPNGAWGRAPRSIEPELPTPMPRRAPVSMEPELPTPMPRRAPRAVDPELPTPMARRSPLMSDPEFATPMARRSPLTSDPEFATPMARRSPMEMEPRWRAPVSSDPELATPAPRSGRAAEGEDAPQVLSVADLDRRLKRVVEGATENVRVAGEVSNFKEVASGHAYFTLKDEEEEASIDCVMYRTAPPRARRLLGDGARVVLRGRATVFVPRGRLQLIADDAQLEGRGALLEALERLKEKLASEGLFDPARKRALPKDAKVIGVVTSGDGAAIHDIIKVAFQRGAVRIVLARAPVQGRDAAQRIARALATLGRMREVEAIIVGRGGGSADDLLAFNEEVLVREAAKCRVPVVSAVGHEIDVSLLDLVADARAATPSQAAEMLVPDAGARRGELLHFSQRMRRAVMQQVGSGRAEVKLREGRLSAFSRGLAERQQWVDDALGRMEREVGRRIAEGRGALAQSERALWSRHPRAVVAAARSAIDPLAQRLAPATARRLAEERRAIEGMTSRMLRAMERRVDAERADLARAAGRLDALSPLSVLARGYAIATNDEGRAVRSSREVSVGEGLRVRVHDGAIVTRVVAVEPGDPEARR